MSVWPWCQGRTERRAEDMAYAINDGIDYLRGLIVDEMQARDEIEPLEQKPAWRPSHPTQSVYRGLGFMYGAPIPASLCATEGRPCDPICGDCLVDPATGLNGWERRRRR